jgi:competence protein ComEA
MSPGSVKGVQVKWQALLVLAAITLMVIFTQGAAIPAAKAGLVDINAASQAELEAVKGIGPVTAKKIIDNRPYKSLTELKKAGLSAKAIKDLKPFLAAKPAAAPAASPAAQEAKKASEPAPAAAQGKKAQAPQPALVGPVDLNTADQKTLEALPGIGPAMAKRIIAARPFQSMDDVSRVKGLSKAKVDALKDKVTISPTKAPPAAAQPTPGVPAAQAPPAAQEAKKASEPAAAQGKKTQAPQPALAGPVDLNTADQKTLEALPGIGPALAKRIIEARPFQSMDDVSRVKGLSKAKVDALKDKVTISPTKAPPAAAQPTPGVPAAQAPPAAQEAKKASEPAPAEKPTPPQEPVTKAQPAAAAKEKQEAPKLAPGQRININTASQDELEKILGIGPVKAQAIMKGRPYKSTEDIMKVRGIKGGTYQKIKDFITVQ